MARLMEGFIPVVMEKWVEARWQAATTSAL